MPHSEHNWQVRSEDAEKAISTHYTKEEAVAAGKKVAKNHEPSRLVIHKHDGTIQVAYTYG
jgi:hypothetical protein